MMRINWPPFLMFAPHCAGHRARRVGQRLRFGFCKFASTYFCAFGRTNSLVVFDWLFRTDRDVSHVLNLATTGRLVPREGGEGIKWVRGETNWQKCCCSSDSACLEYFIDHLGVLNIYFHADETNRGEINPGPVHEPAQVCVRFR